MLAPVEQYGLPGGYYMEVPRVAGAHCSEAAQQPYGGGISHDVDVSKLKYAACALGQPQRENLQRQIFSSKETFHLMVKQNFPGGLAL